MRFGILVPLAGAILAGGASVLAAPVETKDKQLLCTDPISIKEFLQAIQAGDKQWREQIAGCVLSIPGSKMIVLDRNVPAGGIPNVARVRVFSRDGEASVIGYALLENGQ